MTNPEGALEHALRVLRRRKLVILVALISVPLAAYLVSSQQQKEYTASATLLFESGESEIEASREAATNEALAGLPAVAARTAKDLNETIPAGEILASISVSTANEMANLTTISATTTSPEKSARIANAYSGAYIAFRREAAQSQIRRAIALVARRLEELPPGKAAGFQGQTLRERLNELEVERTLKTGQTELVQPAGVPTSPSSPRTKRNVLLGIVLGAILGFALAALLERIDRGARTVEDLEELFGLPLLARIPKSRDLAEGTIEEMLKAPEAEAFRTLRTNLHFLNVDRELKSILIASPEPNDGKSTLARGLAGAMAEMGDKVVLVEADLRKESAFRPGAGPPPEGLSAVLAGLSLENALMEVVVSSQPSEESRTLAVLPSGQVPPNPTELLESDRMRGLIAELNERFDIVVIDSPALGFVSDALKLVPMVSEVLAVGGLGKTTRDAARNFMKQLSLTGKQPVGLVATLTEREPGRYSYYHRPRSILRS